MKYFIFICCIGLFTLPSFAEKKSDSMACPNWYSLSIYHYTDARQAEKKIEEALKSIEHNKELINQYSESFQEFSRSDVAKDKNSPEYKNRVNEHKTNMTVASNNINRSIQAISNYKKEEKRLRKKASEYNRLAKDSDACDKFDKDKWITTYRGRLANANKEYKAITNRISFYRENNLPGIADLIKQEATFKRFEINDLNQRIYSFAKKTTTEPSEVTVYTIKFELE